MLRRLLACKLVMRMLRVVLRATDFRGPAAVCRWGFCGWSFLPSNDEVLAVEDLSSDARRAAPDSAGRWLESFGPSNQGGKFACSSTYLLPTQLLCHKVHFLHLAT